MEIQEEVNGVCWVTKIKRKEGFRPIKHFVPKFAEIIRTKKMYKLFASVTASGHLPVTINFETFSS